MIKYNSKLVGVTFDDRQTTIAMMSGDEPLRLRREPDNEYDPRAVAVDALVFQDYDAGEDWRAIGYIAKDKNEDIAKTLDEGGKASIGMTEITGGGDKSYGVNIYLEYAEPKPVKASERGELVTPTLTPGQFYYNDEKHAYTNKKGERLLSGSVFSHQYVPEFPESTILPLMAKKSGVAESDIKAMWECKAKASRSFGDAIHASLELYGTHLALSDKMGKETALHDQPILRRAVQSFFEGRQSEQAVYEGWVFDESRNLVGQIDRLLILDEGKKLCRVQDYKTNADINKVGNVKTLKAPFNTIQNTTLNGYWLQLSFYAEVLKSAGWTVEGLDIFNFTDEWTSYSHEVIDITVAL